MLFTTLVASAALASVALTQNLQWCGQQQYDPTQYTCTDNSLLCPFFNGAPLQACGNACYWPYRYNCTEGNLEELAPESGPFKLLAFNPAKLAQSPIEACSQKFYVKEGGACTYCPPQAQAIPACSQSQAETVLVAGSSMLTTIPGGQQYYVDPNTAALSFTQAHSSSYPKGAIFGATAYEDGVFLLPNTTGWVLCPPPVGQVPFPLAYQVFAALPGFGFHDGCFPVNILTVDWNGTAVWQYS